MRGQRVPEGLRSRRRVRDQRNLSPRGEIEAAAALSQLQDRLKVQREKTQEAACCGCGPRQGEDTRGVAVVHLLPAQETAGEQVGEQGQQADSPLMRFVHLRSVPWSTNPSVIAAALQRLFCPRARGGFLCVI
jgi:hypothetical protein